MDGPKIDSLNPLSSEEGSVSAELGADGRVVVRFKNKSTFVLEAPTFTVTTIDNETIEPLPHQIGSTGSIESFQLPEAPWMRKYAFRAYRELRHTLPDGTKVKIYESLDLARPQSAKAQSSRTFLVSSKDAPKEPVHQLRVAIPACEMDAANAFMLGGEKHPLNSSFSSEPTGGGRFVFTSADVPISRDDMGLSLGLQSSWSVEQIPPGHYLG